MIKPISYPEENQAICFEVEDSSFWYSHRNRCICEVVKQHLAKGTPFFDVGGGNGVVSRELQKLGFDVSLVEPGFTGIQNAQKRGITQILCATFEECGFSENVIPAIGLFDLLEHIENDSEFLDRVKQVLVRNGKLFMTVPAYPFLWSNHDQQVGHFRRYTIGRLSQQLKQLGYQVDYSTYLFGLLPIPIWLYRTLPSKLGFYKNIDKNIKRKEHHPNQTLFTPFINRWLETELNAIRKQHSLRFGIAFLT